MKTSDQSRSGRAVVEWMQALGRARHARRQRRQLVLELLEPRALLSTITEFPTSSATVVPTAITTGSDGNLWFVEQSGNAIGRINPSTHVIDTFSNGLPAMASLSQITSGPNGDLWFTESDMSANAIGMLNPNNTSQAIQNFGTSAGMSARAVPTGITSADGDIWFTEALADKIGELNPATGKITEFPAPAAMSNLSSQIILGPDGNIWFTEFGGIGYFNPSNPNVVTQVPLPGGADEEPFDLTVGPDGNIWYGAGVENLSTNTFNSYAIGIIDTSTHSFSKEIPLGSGVQPFSITAGPDGNIWFAVSRTPTLAGTIDELNLATQTVTQTLSIPTNVVAEPNPDAITAGPDGNLWFADGSGAIGVVSTNVQPHFVVTTAPPAPVTAGQGFGLTVTAEYGSGIVDPLFTGNVTVSLVNYPGGAGSTLGGGSKLTVPAVQGVATFSGLSLDKAAVGYTLQVASSAINAPAAVTTSGFNVQGAAANHLAVAAQPPGSVPAGSGFGFTVVALDQFNNLATSYSGTVFVTIATNAGGSGTVLSGPTSLSISPASATPGFVTFNGLSLNNVGTGYELGVSSSAGSTTTGHFNVTTALPPPPPPPTIQSESVVFNQKKNKKGKPIGPKTLSGYTITFSTAMNQTALASPGNYQVDLDVPKTLKVKVGKKTVTKKVIVLKPIGFSVAQVTASSVTLTLAGKQTFPHGGEITVIAAPPGGVDNTSGVFLAQNGLLAISKGGKGITLLN